MLEVRDLSVPATKNEPLSNIDFTAKSGEVMVVLGPNSSGKWQLLQTIVGQIAHWQGKIKVNHYNLVTEPLKARGQIGYLSNPFVIDDYLTGYEYLELIGSSYHLSPKVRAQRIKLLAQAFDCSENLYTPAAHLTPDRVQLIGLIASLIHEPKVVVWSEPTESIDYSNQKALQLLLIDLRQRDAIVIIATNNLEFAAAVADTYLLLHDGQVIASGTLKQLANQSGSSTDLVSVYESYYHFHDRRNNRLQA